MHLYLIFVFLSWSKKNAERSMKTGRLKYECRSRQSSQPFSFVSVHAHEHKHTRLLDECVHVCVNMQARGWCQVSFLYCSLPWFLFFWDKVSLNLMLMDTTRLPSQWAQGTIICAPCTSLPPCLGSRIHCYACFFHVGSRYPNSGPHACAVVT